MGNVFLTYFQLPMAETKSIKNWTEDERPREKMQQKGAAALTDAELLAILISSGTPERSALDLARDILGLAHNNLLELGRLTTKELQQIKGIGDARAITICAAMELGRRRQMSEGRERPTVKNAKAAAQILVPLLQDLRHEAFYVMYLDVKCQYIKHELISNGGHKSTVVDVQMILKGCLLNNASQFVVAHNHPSGDITPSYADKMLTQQLQQAALLMNMKLNDHLIVGGNRYFSFEEEGML